MKLLGAFALVVLLAPLLAPYDPGRQFAGYAYAPPMPPRVVDAGALHTPFAYPIHAVDPIERTYDADRSVRLHGFRGDTPWFLLGSDAVGRDVLSRVVIGARLSLGIALLATLGALALGSAIGAIAAEGGGWIDAILMRLADVVIVLPGLYLVLALRGALPVVLTEGQVFAALVFVLTIAGWPTVARGVRGILVTERSSEYAEAARALGASPTRVIVRHLLPAARGFLGVQATLLVPAFVMAEATLSFVGLGFLSPTASWGTMLHDAASVQAVTEAPWLLAPAAAIVCTVFAVHTAAHGAAHERDRIFTANTL
jgi:peptide/nickel transport system permease protein